MSADYLVHLLAVQSVQVTVVVAVVGLVATLLRRWPHLVYALWLAALAKCLVPPLWSSPTGLFSWAAAERPPASARVVVPDTRTNADRPRLSASAPIAAPATGRASTVQAFVDSSPPRAVPWSQIVALTWLSGVAVVLSATTVASARLSRRVRHSAVSITPEFRAMTDDVCRDLGIRRRVRIVASDADVGPALFGTVWPTIVLPREMLDGPSFAARAVLAHELGHLRRGDAIVAAIQRLAVSLWWFHPLIWVMSSRLSAVREQCCDEETVAGLGLDPAAYAQTLFDVARRRRVRSLAWYPGVHVMQLTRQRIGHLMDEKTRFHRRPPRSAWIALAAAALVLLPGAALRQQPSAAAQAVAPTTQPVPHPAATPLILHGSVTDSVTHQPISGATITVTWQRYTEKPGDGAPEEVLGPPTTVTSGADGKYELTVPAEWAAKPWLLPGLSVRHPKYGGTVEDFFGIYRLQSGQPDPGAESALNPKLPPCEEMTGVVIGPDEKPAAGVLVKSASNASDSFVIDEAVTGPRGGFLLHVLKRGGTTLWVLPVDAGAVQQDVSGRWNAGFIRLAGGAPVIGRVTDADGKPVVGASVIVDPAGPGHGVYFPLRMATTDASGEYRTEPLAAGTYELNVNLFATKSASLRATKSEYLPAALNVAGSGAPQRVDFKAPTQVRITLHSVDPQGKPTHALGTVLTGYHDGARFSQMRWRRISDDSIEMLVPKGIERAQIGLNSLCESDDRTVARYRRGGGPAVIADLIDLGTMTRDIDDITVVRYPQAKLTVRLFTPDGKLAASPLNTSNYRLVGSYARPGTQPGAPPDADQLSLFLSDRHGTGSWEADAVMPDEKIKLTATGPGAMPANVTLTLKEGEERSIDIHLTPAPATRAADH